MARLLREQCQSKTEAETAPRKDPSSKILFIEFYSNVPDGHSEAIQYEVLYKYRTAVRYLLIENYLTAVFRIYVPACLNIY